MERNRRCAGALLVARHAPINSGVESAKLPAQQRKSEKNASPFDSRDYVIS